ncbi:MAG: hypothetical protein KY431_09130, partial [Actinobacteria bacterium]|nr:hypothetical protein [Actinomycetota bacterium]
MRRAVDAIAAYTRPSFAASSPSASTCRPALGHDVTPLFGDYAALFGDYAATDVVSAVRTPTGNLTPVIVRNVGAS